MKSIRLVMITIIILLMGIPKSKSTSLITQDFNTVIKQSPIIIEAVVQNIEYKIIPKSALGHVNVTLAVQDIIKGTCSNNIILRRYGINDKYKYLFSDYTPTYLEGKKYIVCINQHPKGYYKPLGLYNGSFDIENSKVTGTGLSIEEFKQKIYNILDGCIEDSSSQQILKETNDGSILKKNGHASTIATSGSHLGGHFVTFNETWNSSYLPVEFLYNPDSAPTSITTSTVIARINDAFTPWNDLSGLNFETITTSDVTTQKQVQNTTNVIFWQDWNTGVLAQEFPYPDPPQGTGTKTGTDILFNTDYNTGSPNWDFSSSALLNRNGDFDYTDILIHELGHSQGLAHTLINSTIMRASHWVNSTVTPLRTLGEGDKAGAVYQHTDFTNLPSTLPHNIALSANKTSFNITSNVTVGSSQTLEIDPGITFNGDFNKKITINGKLNAIGTSSNPITFQKSGTSNWYGLEFSNASYQSELKYCTIKDATYGIYMYNSDITIEYNDIYDISSSFLKFVNGSDGGFGEVSHNEIHDGSDYGIECYSYSDPLFTYNEVYDTDGNSFYGDNTSSFSLGTSSTDGRNAIYNSGEMDVESDNNSTIYALKNWWGSSSPNPWVSANVDYDPYLTTNPLAKGFVRSEKQNGSSVSTLAYQDTVGMREVESATLMYHDGMYDQASILFESLINKYAKYFAGKRSLAFLYKCYERSQNYDEIVKMLSPFTDKDNYPYLYALAQHFTVNELLKNSEFNAAITLCEVILTTQKDNDFEKYALFNLGTIYHYYMNDNKAGENYFRDFLQKYPDDILTSSILSTLGELLPEDSEEDTEEIIGDVFSNYPNPFNPSTNIQFALPEAQDVHIQIFDVLGRRVKLLVDRKMDQGVQQVIWDGRNSAGVDVAAGIYFANLKTGNKVQTIKLLLVR